MTAEKRSALRWFAAEFLVVVTGVLVALAMQSLYQRKEARQREREYVEQLRAELKQTLASMLFSDSVLASSDRAGVMLVRAYRQTAPRDSVLIWLSNVSAGARGRPVLGTAQALVASGDLRLMHDSALRAAIPTYIARMEQAVETLRDLEEDFQRQRALLGEAVDVNEAVREVGAADHNQQAVESGTAGLLGTRYADSTYSPLPGKADRTPFPIDVNAILKDRKAYQALDRMSWAKWGHKAVRGRIRKMAEELLDQIDRSADPKQKSYN